MNSDGSAVTSTVRRSLKERLAELPPEQMAALQQRLLRLPRAAVDVIEPSPEATTSPQSFHQQRLWFIENLQPGTASYNVSRAIRIRGRLNRDALVAALQRLVDRHEPLRTTFDQRDGDAIQRVSTDRTLVVPSVDLSATADDHAATTLHRRLTREARRPFDLQHHLMLRATLFRCADDEHVLQLTIHHLACDGTSLQVLFGELSRTYLACCGGDSTDGRLPPVRLQYSDFARWQHEPRSIERFQQQVDWWKHRLAGAPTSLDLALDRPRPPRESGQGAFEPLVLPGVLCDQLGRRGRDVDATPFMTLLTGFCILIHRYSGEDDFLIGTTSAGRHRPELQDMVGFFVDTVALRVDASGQPTARDMLRRVRRTLLGAMEHSDVPFDRVVTALDLPRDIRRHPLIQVLFNAPPQYTLELADLDVSPVHVDTQTSRLDLELTWSVGANRTTGFTYSTDVYDAATIRAMGRDYLQILEVLARDPERPVSEVPISMVRPLHHALPTSETAVTAERVDFVEPRSALEVQLAAVWRDVLGVHRIGIHDDFFALGGHSLLAMRVVARLRAASRIDLQIRTLFEHPTIATLAHHLGGPERHTDPGFAHAAGLGALAHNAGRTRGAEGRPLGEAARTATDRRPHFPTTRLEDTGEDGRPLSFAQQRTWFLEQLEGEGTSYNLHWSWRIVGPLDVEALRRALLTIVRRHEPLRTVYLVSAGEPFQVVREVDAFDLRVEELRGSAARAGSDGTEFARQTAIERRCLELAEYPFDLASDLMVRAHVLRLADHDHVLQITKHHIATDAWSLRIFRRELALLYAGYRRGASVDLPPLRNRYVDHAERQRNDLQGERLVGLLHYWSRRLTDLRPLIVPGDFARPADVTGRGARHEFVIERWLLQRLTALSRSSSVTLHMTLLAAFQALMARWTGQTDIAVLTPIADRTRADVEDLIGFFANTLVLRTDLSGDPTFGALLGRVREMSLDAYEHQELPFEKLVQALRPDRRGTHHPFAQVLFQLLTFENQELALDDLDIEAIAPKEERVRFDLEVSLLQHPDHIAGRVVYRTDLFEPSTVERLCDSFLSVLETVTAAPDQPLSRLSLLSDAQRDQLLVDWNRTARDSVRDRCLHELVEAQANKTPDAVAAVFAGQRVTYRDLDDRASDIARALEALVEPRRLDGGAIPTVAICLERGLDLVSGILGVLKSGAAYVPLDPDHPEPRTISIVDQSRATVLLTERSLCRRFLTSRLTHLCVDDLRGTPGGAPTIRATPQDGSGRRASPDDAAYVMFTSGSTGVPKGVVVPHRAVVNLLVGMRAQLGVANGDRFCGVASPTFDISVAELFLPLITGGTAVLASRDDARSPDRLADLLDETQPTFVQATPATWQMLCESGWSGCDATLISTGEALPRALGAELLSRGTRLWDLYGPTETTIWSTAHAIESAADLGCIGRPIANTQVYVLDRHRHPVPVGVYGELYIGGAGLARGYLGRPDLTADRFIPNPFSDAGGGRLYRTGDEVRWNANGTVQYRGRLDNQVKLRGFRIELGEIESVLGDVPTVGQCAARLWTDRSGDRHLVAYVSASAPPVSDIRRCLQDRLPSYMVPSVIVTLDQFPLMPSGKIDRAALPTPAGHDLVTAPEYVGPRNEDEEALAAIWRDVLDLVRVGVHDSFFDLGGHSLVVGRMVDRADRHFPATLRLADVFRQPTIAELVTLLTQRHSSERIGTAPGAGYHFLSVLRQGSRSAGTVVFIGDTSTRLVTQLPGDLTVLGLAFDGVQAQPFRGLSVPQLAQAYAGEILSAASSERVVIVGFSYGGLLAWATTHRLRARSRRDFKLVLIEPTTHAPALRQTRLEHARKMAEAATVRAKQQWMRLGLAAGRSLTIDQRWVLYSAHMHKVGREYQPPGALGGDVALVAGRGWLERNGDIWATTRLQQPPQVHHLGSVEHVALFQQGVPLTTCANVVIDLMG